MSFGNFFVAVIVQLKTKGDMWTTEYIAERQELVDVIHECWTKFQPVEAAVDLVVRDEEIHGIPTIKCRALQS